MYVANNTVLEYGSKEALMEAKGEFFNVMSQQSAVSMEPGKVRVLRGTEPRFALALRTTHTPTPGC